MGSQVPVSRSLGPFFASFELSGPLVVLFLVVPWLDIYTESVRVWTRTRKSIHGSRRRQVLSKSRKFGTVLYHKLFIRTPRKAHGPNLDGGNRSQMGLSLFWILSGAGWVRRFRWAGRWGHFLYLGLFVPVWSFGLSGPLVVLFW